MFPFAMVMVVFTLLLAARIRPSGMAIVLVGSIAIAALEIGLPAESPRCRAKVAQLLEPPRVHRS